MVHDCGSEYTVALQLELTEKSSTMVNFTILQLNSQWKNTSIPMEVSCFASDGDVTLKAY